MQSLLKDTKQVSGNSETDLVLSALLTWSQCKCTMSGLDPESKSVSNLS